MTRLIEPDEFSGKLGETRTYDIGLVRRLDAQRYARAVEDENPLFHDPAYAREQGFDDVVVPPNYPPAIIERGEGEPATELREDGVAKAFFPIPIPDEAVLMGGGQDLLFDRYFTAGSFLTVEETFVDLYQKESDSMGVLTFIELSSDFLVETDTDRGRVIHCDERYIVGDRDGN